MASSNRGPETELCTTSSSCIIMSAPYHRTIQQHLMTANSIVFVNRRSTLSHTSTQHSIIIYILLTIQNISMVLNTIGGTFRIWFLKTDEDLKKTKKKNIVLQCCRCRRKEMVGVDGITTKYRLFGFIFGRYFGSSAVHY